MAHSVNIKPNEFDSNEVEFALPNVRSHFNKKATDKETMTCRICKKDVKAARGQYTMITIDIHCCH